MIGSLDKNLSIGPENGQLQPESKKIQDYIYRFADNIGTGNFSKVFKGYHQINPSRNKNNLAKFIKKQSTAIIIEHLNENIKNAESSECNQMLVNFVQLKKLCGDLEKKLKKVDHFKEKQIYQIAVDIYEGLKYLAKKHIIHRDIKTSNIFIHNGVHKIADFGFAQISQTDFKDISVGSPVYMSPEGYINNIYGPKTDVWAFGVLLYELAEGKTPYNECRTETQLKQNLLKQIDYSHFTSNISSQLKNLIIQCLDINPTTRIRIADIQNTFWMKKAMKIADQNRRNAYKQNINYEKLSNNYSAIHKKFSQSKQQLTLKTSQRSPTPPLDLNQQPKFKKYLQKLHILQKTNANMMIDLELQKRKHSTLQKMNKTSKDDSRQKNNDSGKIFYSPKNTIFKFQKALGLKQLNLSNKFNNSSPDNHQKLNGSKPQTFKNYQNNLLDLTLVKNKNSWTNNQKEGKIPNQKQDKFSIFKQKDKYRTNLNNNSNLQNKGQKLVKNTQKISQEQKNYFSCTSPNHNLSFLQNYQKPILKAVNEQKKNKQRFSQFIQFKAVKQKQLHLDKRDSHEFNKQSKNQIFEKLQKKTIKNNQLAKVLSRKLKFGDCIGLIHYCRLCYKFACLFDEAGDSQQSKKFLTSWSVQLLLELNAKIDQGQILFSNQNNLINNPSIIPGQTQKKKKLKDVTQQYLNKYSIGAKGADKSEISLKQASSFIYNIYLSKIHKFKEKTKDKKAYLFFALISYLSVLDKETRSLVQFVYQMKNSIQCRKVQKLLNIKISQFNRKTVQQITSQTKQKSNDQ